MMLTILALFTSATLTLDTGFEARASALVEVPALIKGNCTHQGSFIDCDGEVWLNPEGTLHLFAVDSLAQVQRIDQSIHHGSTYGRKLLCVNGQVMMFGGTGLFQHNAQLLFFDKTNREWFAQHVKGLDWSRLVYFSTQLGDSLIVLSKEDEKTATLEMGVVDLNTFSYAPLVEYDDLDFFEKYKATNFTLDSKTLTYLLGTDPYGLLFDKRSLNFYRTNFSVMFPSKEQGQAFLDENELVVYAKFQTGNQEWYRFDISNFKERFPIKTFIRNEATGFGRARLYALLVLSIIALVLWRRRGVVLRKKKAGETDQHLMALLAPLDGQLVNGSALQQALGLNYENPDTMRVKMNAMIKEINGIKPGCIERVRDQNDSRLVNYRISIGD